MEGKDLYKSMEKVQFIFLFMIGLSLACLQRFNQQSDDWSVQAFHFVNHSRAVDGEGQPGKLPQASGPGGPMKEHILYYESFI